MTARAPDNLVDAARSGDRAALARALSAVERGNTSARQISAALAGSPADTYTIGMTGAPGAGKSTLTSAVVSVLRRGAAEDAAAPSEPQAVAVLAVDPSSPYTGGAILGDRVRMGEHSLDAGVFVRSMATRGHLGGLAVATPEAARLLAAAGYPWVVVETVGVGQVEVEVAGHADTTVVVVNPGWGDEVQAAKAGLMEIADVFVVNKADRPGADETRRDLERMLHMAPAHNAAAGRRWRPPVVMATAVNGDGAADVLSAVVEHREHLEVTGELGERRRRRAADELSRMVAARLAEQARMLTGGDEAGALAAKVAAGTVDVWSAVDRLLD